MKLRKLTTAAMIASSGAMMISCGSDSEQPQNSAESVTEAIEAPVAEKIPHEMTIHGHTRIDDYYWMRERDADNVVKYLNAENDYTKAKLQHTETLQDELFNEIVGRIKQTDESVPYKSNGYYYYTRYEEGKEYAIHCRKKESLDAAEEVMLDVNELAEGQAFCQVSGKSVSDNNQLMAYGVDFVSRRQYTLKFRNLETGEEYPESLENTTGGASWAADNKTVFYTLKDSVSLRSVKVMRHVLGTPQSEDVEIFHEQDEIFGTGVYRSKSRKYMIIVSYSTLTSEYQFLDASNPEGSFTVFQPRERGLEYSISHYNGQFFIRTNLDAKNFRLMSVGEGNTSKENWKEVIAHRDDVFLEGIEIFRDFLVVEERKDGLTQMRVMPQDGEEYYIDFGEETYVAFPSTNPEFETDQLRYYYSSLTTPGSTFDFDLGTKEKNLLKQQEVVGGYDASLYHAERQYAKATDGTMVPISLVYRKDLFKKDGSNPCLLYAYGSYGANMDPYFSSVRLSILDRGFVYAIAHIRGGQELGRDWYEDGKLLKKKNTFTDYIACADHLIAEQYSNKDKMCAMGGSAGGLLMGAVINMGGDRFKAVVAAVPFVDVVTTMLDEDIPLTTGEYDEWGNPNEKEYYEYMLSYSPYDNIEAKEYPSMLVTTGYHDSQVQYWEPAKWVAKLRELKTDQNTLLFNCNMDAGHGGASGRFERYRETAMEYAFFMNELGLLNP